MSSFPPGPGANPYGAPVAPVSDAAVADGGYVERGRSLPASRGFAWYGEAWRVFTVAPMAWIGIWLLFALCLLVVSIIPILGMVANALLTAILIGGVAQAARAADRTRAVSVGQLFGAFGSHAGPLALIGLLQLIAAVVLFMVGSMMGGALLFSMIGMGTTVAPTSVPELFSRAWLPLMGVGMVLGLLYMPIAFASWLATALVALNNVPVLDALRMGFGATFRNLLPLLVFTVAFFVLAILASVPLLLGWFLLGPLVLCAIYVQYREIFAAPA